MINKKVQLGVSEDAECFVDKFKGLEYCKAEDLVNKDFMKTEDFDTKITPGGLRNGTRNETTYFINPDKAYVYAECYFVGVDRYVKLIISKKMFYEQNLERKAIILTPGKGRKKNRCIPSVRFATGRFDLHKLFGIVGEVDHITGSYNLITDENYRGVSESQNCRNKEQPYVARNTDTGKYIVRFTIKELVPDKDQDDLKELGFEVVDTGIVNIYNEFITEVAALKALRMLEERFYKEFAYCVVNDMRGRFDLKFQQLILGTMSEDDVIKTVLKEYANDAYSVYRYNLIPLCEKYGIPYNEGRTLPNGDLVNE